MATWQSKTSFALGIRPNIKKLPNPLTGTIKIGTVGGSITYGYDGYDDSYRYNLYNYLTTRGGLTVSFVGPYSNGTAPANNTFSIIGTSVKEFGPGGTADMELTPRLLGTSFMPDILIVEGIVNTANSDVETATWANDYFSSVVDWATLVPQMRFVLLGPFESGADDRRLRIETIRGQWNTVMTNLSAAGLFNRFVSTPKICIERDVDQTYNEALGSRVHWNTRGQLKAADNIFPLVMNAAGYDTVW